MISIEELIKEVSSIKVTSDQISIMMGTAGQNMQSSSASIAALVRGSRTGEEAVASLSIAARSVSEAAVSIRALSRTCDECVAHLSR